MNMLKVMLGGESTGNTRSDPNFFVLSLNTTGRGFLICIVSIGSLCMNSELSVIKFLHVYRASH